jgi:hypothetical protein
MEGDLVEDCVDTMTRSGHGEELGQHAVAADLRRGRRWRAISLKTLCQRFIPSTRQQERDKQAQEGRRGRGKYHKSVRGIVRNGEPSPLIIASERQTRDTLQEIDKCSLARNRGTYVYGYVPRGTEKHNRGT